VVATTSTPRRPSWPGGRAPITSPATTRSPRSPRGQRRVGAAVVYDGVGRTTFDAGLRRCARAGTWCCTARPAAGPAVRSPAAGRRPGRCIVTRPTLGTTSPAGTSCAGAPGTSSTGSPTAASRSGSAPPIRSTRPPGARTTWSPGDHAGKLLLPAPLNDPPAILELWLPLCGLHPIRANHNSKIAGC
jgi:hypothetical protein